MKLIIQDCQTGKGVFCQQLIRQGEKIIEFTGPFLRQAETTMETYALQIGPDLYIGPSGSFDDYINHSCEPNAGMVIENKTATLFALRDIHPSEEITFDYSTVMAEEGWQITCLCGRPACRRIVGPGQYLPAPLKAHYRRLGILAPYIH